MKKNNNIHKTMDDFQEQGGKKEEVLSSFELKVKEYFTKNNFFEIPESIIEFRLILAFSIMKSNPFNL